MMKVVEMDSCCMRSDLATLNSELNSKSNLARSGLPACQCLSGKHAQRYGYAITRKKRHYSVLGLWRAGNNRNNYQIPCLFQRQIALVADESQLAEARPPC